MTIQIAWLVQEPNWARSLEPEWGSLGRAVVLHHGMTREHLATHVLEAPASSVTFDGLDGEADWAYLLVWRIEAYPLARAEYELRPNGVTEGLRAQHRAMAFNRWQEATSWPIGQVERMVAECTRLYCWGVAVIDARVSRRTPPNARTVLCEGARGAEREQVHSFLNHTARGTWDDRSSVLTRLEVHASRPDAIGPGSLLGLFRLVRPAPQARA